MTDCLNCAALRTRLERSESEVKRLTGERDYWREQAWDTLTRWRKATVAVAAALSPAPSPAAGKPETEKENP